MTPDASSWRTNARYDYVENLSPSDLAWEWLRRNDSYDRDFALLLKAGDQRSTMLAKIRQRWGLRFPGRPIEVPAHCASFLDAPA
ncbi:hypothetical protein CVM52_06090 [Pseudooceanicola lipolyticus]|uniref:Transcriptional regulator-like domain-containing protein n=1 Tax=Pseudooceanicola lipolyticus TaxID=2029104 RepID=A0A2M8J465_9RHOB|nr:hypothetical protein CVM52_06090 [Pseudooceanicola lipolyticus]